jgi:hypothetical protein
MYTNRERLSGRITSYNHEQRIGNIKADSGEMYFFAASESKSFDFDSTKTFVTFATCPSNGRLPIARDIEYNHAGYEEMLRKKYGAAYVPNHLRPRKTLNAEDREFKRKQRQERMVERERGTPEKEEVLRQRYGANYIPLGKRRADYKPSTVPVAGE